MSDKDFIPPQLASRRRFWASSSMVHASPRQCPSLEDMKARIQAATEDDFLAASRMTPFTLYADQYAGYEWGRVCRTCAWEPLASFLLTVPDVPRVEVTFSACSPKKPASTYAPSIRADARLRRVAARAGLEVAGAGLGPVAYGPVPALAVPFLTANNVSFTQPALSVEEPAVVALAWNLWLTDAIAAVGDFPLALVTARDILGLPAKPKVRAPAARSPRRQASAHSR